MCEQNCSSRFWAMNFLGWKEIKQPNLVKIWSKVLVITVIIQTLVESLFTMILTQCLWNNTFEWFSLSLSLTWTCLQPSLLLVATLGPPCATFSPLPLYCTLLSICPTCTYAWKKYNFKCGIFSATSPLICPQNNSTGLNSRNGDSQSTVLLLAHQQHILVAVNFLWQEPTIPVWPCLLPRLDLFRNQTWIPFYYYFIPVLNENVFYFSAVEPLLQSQHLFQSW
jgi:hypothetical protein